MSSSGEKFLHGGRSSERQKAKVWSPREQEAGKEPCESSHGREVMAPGMSASLPVSRLETEELGGGGPRGARTCESGAKDDESARGRGGEPFGKSRSPR